MHLPVVKSSCQMSNGTATRRREGGAAVGSIMGAQNMAVCLFFASGFTSIGLGYPRIELARLLTVLCEDPKPRARLPAFGNVT